MMPSLIAQAPPIGGALYFRFGWHAPFIFTIILCAIDTVMRMFVIEQKDLKQYGLTLEASASHGSLPRVETAGGESESPENTDRASGEMDHAGPSSPFDSKDDDEPSADIPSPGAETGGESSRAPGRPLTLERTMSEKARAKQELSILEVFVALVKSSRGMTGFFITFVFGLCIGTLDPTLVSFHSCDGSS